MTRSPRLLEPSEILGMTQEHAWQTEDVLNRFGWFTQPGGRVAYEPEQKKNASRVSGLAWRA
jgi:hypothetical protein